MTASAPRFALSPGPWLWLSLAVGAGVRIFLVLATLWERRGNVVGVGLCTLALATQIVFATWGHPIEGDECFAWINLLVVASVWILPFVSWRATDPPPSGF